jgi:hypothetical protein
MKLIPNEAGIHPRLFPPAPAANKEQLKPKCDAKPSILDREPSVFWNGLLDGPLGLFWDLWARVFYPVPWAWAFKDGFFLG